MIIIFEGCDKSGKSTLFREVGEKIKWKHVMIDRGIMSNIAYTLLKNDRDKSEIVNYLNYDEELSKLKFIVQILCFCDNKTLMSRFKKENETDVEHDYIEIEKNRQAFHFLGHLTKIKTLKVNTAEPIDKCVDKILKWIEKVEDEKNENIVTK